MPADFEISPIIPPVSKPEVPVTEVPQTPTGHAPTTGVVPPRMKSNKTLKILIIAAALLFITAVGSLWLGGNSFSTNGVVITLEAVDRVTSGDEVVYTIKYRNNTNIELHDMKFRLFWPDDSLVLVDGSATTPESEGFEVASLAPGEEGSRELKAFLVGDKGTIKSARLHLVFEAGTLRSAFEKEVSASTTITDLPVTLTLVAPPTAVSGSNIQYILDVRNDSETDLADLRLELKYPDGFEPAQLQPQPSQGKNIWSIATLKVGEGKRFRAEGVLSGNEQEAKTVEAVLRRNINGQYVDYVRTDAFTMISSPLLSVSIVPNDSRDYMSFAGDTLRYSITYKNNSRYSLLGLLLGVKLEGEMYDLSRLQVTGGFFDESSRTVVFDSAGSPALGALPSGGSGRVTFSVPLKAGLTGGGGSGAFFVKATARLATTNVPAGLDISEVTALDSVITRISTQPSLTQSILYDSGLGSGPLPPQVSQETTFTVRWQLTNPGNDVKNSTVTATLAPGVSWKGGSLAVMGGSAPVFDSNTSKVTWNIGTLPFGTGNGMPRYEATFQISIRPSSNQAGASPTLVNAATLDGTDGFTSQVIQVRLRDATTDSIEGHSGQGRVVQ